MSLLEDLVDTEIGEDDVGFETGLASSDPTPMSMTTDLLRLDAGIGRWCLCKRRVDAKSARPST